MQSQFPRPVSQGRVLAGNKKGQLDVTDGFLLQNLLFLNIFRAPLCPSSGTQEYYTGGCCLWYLVLWFTGCWSGVEL